MDSLETTVRNAANNLSPPKNPNAHTISNIVIPRAAQEAFSNIIEFPLMSIHEFIRKFNAQCSSENCNLKDVTFFLKAAPSLPPIIVTRHREDNTILTIRGKPATLLAEGTYGRVYKTNDGEIYKQPKQSAYPKNRYDKTKHLNRYYRDSFVEGYLQTVLQTDPEYGDNICKLVKMYFEKSTLNIFYQMEAMDGLFCKYTENKPLNDVAPLMIQLSKALSHFDTVYGFRHRDLHQGNVMVKGDTLKILDFGQGCFTLKHNELTVTHSSENIPCESYDLLIFLASIYNFCPLHNDVKGVIHKILTDDKFGNIMTLLSNILKLYGYAKKETWYDHVSHYMYTMSFDDIVWQIPWTNENKEKIEKFVEDADKKVQYIDNTIKELSKKYHYESVTPTNYLTSIGAQPTNSPSTVRGILVAKLRKEKEPLKQPAIDLIRTLPGDETLIEAFKKSDIITNLDPENFVKFWTAPSLGGFRKTKKRSKRRQNRSRKRRS